MYPLVEPAMDEIVSQVIEKQSTENITYSENNQYTSMILISAIDNTLKKSKDLTVICEVCPYAILNIQNLIYYCASDSVASVDVNPFM